jgi:hypothetical protein
MSAFLPERLDRLRIALEAYRRRLEGCLGDPSSPEFTVAMNEFLEFIRTVDDREAYAELEAGGQVDRYRAFLGPLVLRFIWAMERVGHAQAVARSRWPGGSTPLVEAPAWGAYTHMGQSLEGIALGACRQFAMVGCGPLPDSLLYMEEHTDIESLVGIERDPKALGMARELVAAFGLERIRIVEGEGERIDYGEFDLICPSVFVTPRLATLERIAATAREGVRVILREPFYTGTLLFEPVLDVLPPPLEVIADSRSEPGRLMLKRYVLGLGRRRERTGP